MKHFTMAELTRSATARAKGLDNTPTAEHRSNIEMSVAQLLDPLREAWAVKCANEQWGTPAIRVSSGYRGFAPRRIASASRSTWCRATAVWPTSSAFAVRGSGAAPSTR